MTRSQGERITVGKPGDVRIKDLIAALGEFNPETQIMHSCDRCSHGSSGSPLMIADFTHATFGYIDLSVNHIWNKGKEEDE